MEDSHADIHPQLQGAATKLPSFTFSRANLWLMRVAMALMRAPKPSDDVAIANVLIPNLDQSGKIRLRIYRPTSDTAPDACLLWLHGGGYVIGKPKMDDLVCAQYAREAGITVVSVDYRLAPTHPFPAGLEDSYAALSWVQSQSGFKGRIAIGGASAGGGLAAALAQLARSRGEIHPLLQLLIYPMLDDRSSLPGRNDDRTHIGWNCASNRFAWKAYLGKDDALDAMSAFRVPARNDDLSGLPPAWIGVGTLDLFYQEDIDYAQRLRECGVACELVQVAGGFHGFDVFAATQPVVQEFRSSQLAALIRYLRPP